MSQGKAITCLTCGTTIRSKHVHHLVRCTCPTEETFVFVDGGDDYLRMGAGPQARWKTEDGVEHRTNRWGN